MMMLGNGGGVAKTTAVGLLAILLPFNALAQDPNEQPVLPAFICHGYDGDFEAKFSNQFNDFYVVAEIGCEFPGFSWIVRDCRTGDGLHIADNASRFFDFDDLAALRNEVYEQIGDGSLELLEAKLVALGIPSERLERREGISCRT